jgi:hypothetical protein
MAKTEKEAVSPPKRAASLPAGGDGSPGGNNSDTRRVAPAALD